LRVASAPVLVAVDAVTYALSALFVSRITYAEPPKVRAARRRMRSEIAEGLSFVVRHPLLVRITACTSISNLFSGVQSALLVLFVLDVLRLGPQTLGLVWAFGALG